MFLKQLCIGIGHFKTTKNNSFSLNKIRTQCDYAIIWVALAGFKVRLEAGF